MAVSALLSGCLPASPTRLNSFFDHDRDLAVYQLLWPGLTASLNGCLPASPTRPNSLASRATHGLRALHSASPSGATPRGLQSLLALASQTFVFYLYLPSAWSWWSQRSKRSSRTSSYHDRLFDSYLRVDVRDDLDELDELDELDVPNGLDV